MAKEPLAFSKFFPSPKELLELEPEDIAPLLLQYLNHGARRNLNWHNFIRSDEFRSYAGTLDDEVAKALTEAWKLLEREVLLAPEPEQQPGWFFITRRGKSLQTHTDFEAFRRGGLLRPEFLDPTLSTKVRPLFLRGDYDTAVFRAFKEVETRVRAAAGLPQELIGTDLMRKAFHVDTGKLADPKRTKAERQATSDLFAGAIGLFKNPSSHRDIPYNYEDAAELIQFANYLLWVVESQTDINKTGETKNS